METLCQKTFLTEYRVYEILWGFWQNNRIMPYKLPRKAARCPLPDKKQTGVSAFPAGAMSFFAVHCFALLVVGLGFLLHSKILKNQTIAQYNSSHELFEYHSDIERRVRALYYHAMSGHVGFQGKQPDTLGVTGPAQK